jgi:hypothetical protein
MTSTAADVPTVSDDSDFTAGDGAKAGCRPEAVAVKCPRCGETMQDRDCAEGCEDFNCPFIGGER